MKTSYLTAVCAAIPLAIPAAMAQSSHMTGGDMGGFGWMGGYGGLWTVALLVIVVAGVVAWVAKRKGD